MNTAGAIAIGSILFLGIVANGLVIRYQGRHPVKFRRIPAVVEAIQFTGDNITEIWDKFGTAGIYGPTENNPDYLLVEAQAQLQDRHRHVRAFKGDWLVKGQLKDTFQVYRPIEFELLYSKIED